MYMHPSVMIIASVCTHMTNISQSGNEKDFSWSRFHEVDKIVSRSFYKTLKLWEIHNCIFMNVPKIKWNSWKFCFLNKRTNTYAHTYSYIMNSQ